MCLQISHYMFIANSKKYHPAREYISWKIRITLDYENREFKGVNLGKKSVISKLTLSYVEAEFSKDCSGQWSSGYFSHWCVYSPHEDRQQEEKNPKFCLGIFRLRCIQLLWRYRKKVCGVNSHLSKGEQWLHYVTIVKEVMKWRRRNKLCSSSDLTWHCIYWY